jgi:hypothetical protein
VVRGTRPDDELTALAALYAAKAAAEQDAADAVLPAVPVRRCGIPDARLLLVKGEPGTDDVARGEGPCGRDRDAAIAALSALGIESESVLGLVTRPAPGTDPVLAAARVARYLEAADPELAIALDEVARDDLARAVGLPTLLFGKPQTVAGRTLLAVDGLEASLADESRKRKVWRQFKGLTPPKPDVRKA